MPIKKNDTYILKNDLPVNYVKKLWWDNVIGLSIVLPNNKQGFLFVRVTPKLCFRIASGTTDLFQFETVTEYFLEPINDIFERNKAIHAVINEAIQDFKSLFIVSENIPQVIRHSANFRPLNTEEAEKGISYAILSPIQIKYYGSN